MAFHRISIKYFLSDTATLDLAKIIGIFHKWIQQKTVGGLPIDVADYRHVPEGPGVMLIGHDFDYSVDLADGRAGLCYLCKRTTGSDDAELLRTTMRGALFGCRLLEDELNRDVTFRTDEARLVIPDRLRAPNRKSTLDGVRGSIIAALGPIYSPAPVRVERVDGDERQPLTLTITAEGATDLDKLLGRLSL